MTFIYGLAIAVAVLLAVYLGVALLNPEWFE
ncbi:MAG TPA: K(+)-transporting ATPase subunit F [Rhodanobacter sp.]|nr:K(+)-transporting ATPase subunit F [Rhodanobacter sp.]